MSSGAVAAAEAPPRPGFRLGLGGPGLTRGLVVTYLSLMVLLPIAAVVSKSFSDGLDSFWNAISTPEAVAASRFANWTGTNTCTGTGVTSRRGVSGSLVFRPS